jgi:hypothetical protein
MGWDSRSPEANFFAFAKVTLWAKSQLQRDVQQVASEFLCYTTPSHSNSVAAIFGCSAVDIVVPLRLIVNLQRVAAIDNEVRAGDMR